MSQRVQLFLYFNVATGKKLNNACSQCSFIRCSLGGELTVGEEVEISQGMSGSGVIVTAHTLLITVLRSGISAGMLEKRHPHTHQLAELTSGIHIQFEHKPWQRLRKHWPSLGHTLEQSRRGEEHGHSNHC